MILILSVLIITARFLSINVVTRAANLQAAASLTPQPKRPKQVHPPPPCAMNVEGRLQMASIHRTPPSLPKRASDGESQPHSQLQPQPKQLRHQAAAPPQPQPQQPRSHPYPLPQPSVPRSPVSPGVGALPSGYPQLVGEMVFFLPAGGSATRMGH